MSETKAAYSTAGYNAKYDAEEERANGPNDDLCTFSTRDASRELNCTLRELEDFQLYADVTVNSVDVLIDPVFDALLDYLVKENAFTCDCQAAELNAPYHSRQCSQRLARERSRFVKDRARMC
jgi:hypothetical protein